MSSFWTWFFWLALVASLLMLVKAVLWFIQPILIYSRRKTEKDIEFYISGKKLTKSETGLPFLLRQESTKTPNLNTIKKSELCGLGLVVPCYNEEKRLPQMLSEHITYI